MNPEMVAQLRDIQGLDPIPGGRWPPAGGCWPLLIAAAVHAPGFAGCGICGTIPPVPGTGDAWKQLRELKQQAASLPAQQLAGDLSELLRRIAVARLGREQAAGLTGERWLDWLQEHDPAGFDWQQMGQAVADPALCTRPERQDNKASNCCH